MKAISAAISFLMVFTLVFVVAGWLLMPYLPPLSRRHLSLFEADYWFSNWLGALLGLLCGIWSAWSTYTKTDR